MKNFVKLNKNEMKMVMGGVYEEILSEDGCKDECTKDSDCTEASRKCMTVTEGTKSCKRCIRPGLND